MDAYTLLRQQAAEKRDKVIRAANAEYRRAIREIEALRHNLAGEPLNPKVAGSNQSIIQLIHDLMPKDRAFLIKEIADALGQANPGRSFRATTLRQFFVQMQKHGIISKVGHDNNGQTLWAVPGVQVAECLNGEMKLIDMVHNIVRESGPMTRIEIIQKMQERGYRPESDPRRLVGWLLKAAKKYEGRFSVGDDGRWTVIQSEK